MHVIHAINVNDAYRQGLALCAERGIDLPSRNGPVKRVAWPVTTRYANPTERVLLDPQRHANPFFHLFEALWMLAGRNDLAYLTQFLPSFKQFSDDGETLHGAYGYRWRRWPLSDVASHNVDQVGLAIAMLRQNVADRRAVIGMWDPARDLAIESKDIPCNDLIKCAIVDGALDIQVFCRSNDIVFGAYGANAVHMSILQEYMASMIEVRVGAYYQISGDYHAYVESPYAWDTYWPLDTSDAMYADPYGHSDGFGGPVVSDPLTVFPLVTNRHTFDLELRSAVEQIADHSFEGTTTRFENTFFSHVAHPMYYAHRLMQQRTDFAAMKAIRLLDSVYLIDGARNDWLTAGAEWCRAVLTHRLNKGSEGHGQ